MFETHSRIVFRSGTGARRPSLKFLRNALCVAITDSLFLKNVSTTKLRCLSEKLMALSENGKTTVNERDPSHHCISSRARAVTLPNVGVISAAPCIFLQTMFLCILYLSLLPTLRILKGAPPKFINPIYYQMLQYNHFLSLFLCSF